MSAPLIDANVILRFLAGDTPDHAVAATALMARVEAGELAVEISEPVIFEVVFTLERYYKVAREEIRELVRSVLTLPGAIVSDLITILGVLDEYVSGRVSFVDAYLAVRARQQAVSIISFDRGFDRVPGVTRVEPGA